MQVIAAALALTVGVAVSNGAVPLGTGFTYQGQLKEGSLPADGEYDFVFKLFDAPSGPGQVGSDFPVDNWTVTNGLFTVALDFGVDAVNGQARARILMRV